MMVERVKTISRRKKTGRNGREEMGRATDGKKRATGREVTRREGKVRELARGTGATVRRRMMRRTIHKN